MANVIVADDDALIRGVVRSLLLGVGQTVFLAACGEEAVAYASQVRASLVLLDLNMPRLNGLLACEKLRRLPGYENTPIVILSAHDGERERHAAARVGTTLFLAKPFQPALLLRALSPYLTIDASMQKAISLAAIRAREIAPLVGRAFERASAPMEREPLGLAPARRRSDPPRPRDVVPERAKFDPEIAPRADIYEEPLVNLGEDDGGVLRHPFRWLISRTKAG
jgi:CheY-like chemotaxis protein